jgi:hypothetical protein
MATDATPWGFSLFCDDLRQEIGGKISIMGLYQTDMIFPEAAQFPLVLPKFAILTKYYESQPNTEDINFRIFFPGDERDTPTIRAPFQRPPSSVTPPTYALEEDQERLFMTTVPFVISPFPIKQEGFIKVRAMNGATITKLGSLMIRKAKPGEDYLSLPPSSPLPLRA